MMKRLFLGLLLSLAVSAAHAACPATLELQDANGVKAAAKYTDDGSGNCQVNTAAQDGANSTLGAKGDSAWVSGSGSVIALLKGLIAAVQLPPGLGTTGGWTPFTKIGLATITTAVKTTTGQLGFAQCDNPNAAVSYVQIFNLTTGAVTLGVTAPTQIVPVPANLSNGFVMNLSGMQYSTAISVAATTAASGGTAPSSALNCTFGYN